MIDQNLNRFHGSIVFFSIQKPLRFGVGSSFFE